jgi:hypothetical protein
LATDLHGKGTTGLEGAAGEDDQAAGH